jgi:hypothetical protein
MELIENLDKDITILNNGIVKKSRGRPKTIKDETEIIEKKPRGRPKKIIDKPETEITETIEIIPKQRGRPRKENQIILTEENEKTETEKVKHFGRPKKYNSNEEYLQSKRINSRLAYDGKGKIYLKILSFKKNYNLNLNTEDIKNKSLEELTEILLSISNKIQEIKKEKHNDYINILKNKINKLEMKDDFKPKSKYLTF